MTLTFSSSPQGHGGLVTGLGGGCCWDLCTSLLVLKSASAPQYFSITSWSPTRVVAGFLASLEEHDLDLRPFTVVRMIASLLYFGCRP